VLSHTTGVCTYVDGRQFVGFVKLDTRHHLRM
jgi:hypothetical protein